MCVTIVHRGRLLSSIGELRKALYPLAPVMSGDYRPPFRDDLCLCPVDAAATARLVGCEMRDSSVNPYDFDAMRIYFVPRAEIADGSWDRRSAEARVSVEAEWAAIRARLGSPPNEMFASDPNVALRGDPRDPLPPADGMMSEADA